MKRIRTASATIRTFLNRTLEPLAVALAIVASPLGAVTLGFLKRPSLDATTRQWFWLWFWVSIPLIVRGILLGTVYEVGLALLNGIANVFVASLLRATHKGTVLGLLIILTLIAITGTVQNRFNESAWYKQDGQVEIQRVGYTGSVYKFTTIGPSRVTRYWYQTAPVTDLRFEFEARKIAGNTAWDWYRSDAGLQLSLVTENGRTHVAIQGSKQNSYLVRHFETGNKLSGQRFRVQLEARVQTATKTKLNPKILNPKISFVDDSGVLIREKTISLDTRWQSFTLEDQMPEQSKGSRLSVTLSKMFRTSIDIRDVQLERRQGTIWKEVGPMAPSGFDLTMMWPGTTPTTISLPIKPNDQWQKYGFSLSVPPEATTGTLASILHLGPHLTLEIQNATLKNSTPRINNQSAGQIVEHNPLSDLRLAFWFGHPNIAGHIIATIGMTVQVLNQNMIPALIAFLLTGFDVSLTGSRTALIGITASIPWMAVLAWQSKRRLRVIFVAVMLLGVGAIILSPQLTSRLSLLEIGSETPRSTIWATAWQAFIQHPWTGLNQTPFSKYFSQTVPEITNDAVQHAHNIWLEMAQRYGISGLLSVTILTGGLLRIAWNRGQFRGLLFVAPVLIMNAFDTTLLQPSLLCCLYLGLNGMQTHDRVPVTTQTGLTTPQNPN